MFSLFLQKHPTQPRPLRVVIEDVQTDHASSKRLSKKIPDPMHLLPNTTNQPPFFGQLLQTCSKLFHSATGQDLEFRFRSQNEEFSDGEPSDTEMPLLLPEEYNEQETEEHCTAVVDSSTCPNELSVQTTATGEANHTLDVIQDDADGDVNDDDEDDEVRIDLDALVEDCTFYERYVMTEAPFVRPTCRIGIDKSTNRKVLMIFFPGSSNRLDRAVRIHEALEHRSSRVSKILYNTQKLDHLPPCIVVEGGDCMLIDRMARDPIPCIDRKCMMHSMLLALRDLHECGIVCGNLKPSHFAWFHDDECWKLVGLESATDHQEPDRPPRSNKYTSPELMTAISAHKSSITLNPAMDMWSFGVIACELATCSSIRDVLGFQLDLDRHFAASPSRTATASDMFSVKESGKTLLPREAQQLLHFAWTFLCRDPQKRRTAAQALQDPIFCTGLQMDQLFDRDVEAMCSVTSSDADALDIAAIIQCSMETAAAPDQTPVCNGEAFLQDSPRSLEDPPIRTVPFHSSSISRIQISVSHASDIQIEEVEHVGIAIPDKEATSLDFTQRYMNNAVELTATLPSLIFETDEDMKVMIDDMDGKENFFMELDVYIRIIVHHPSRKIMNVHRHLRCEMTAPVESHWMIKKLGLVSLSCWTCIHRWMKAAVLPIAFCFRIDGEP